MRRVHRSCPQSILYQVVLYQVLLYQVLLYQVVLYPVVLGPVVLYRYHFGIRFTDIRVINDA